jgi:AcrR family transcriptional regulator
MENTVSETLTKSDAIVEAAGIMFARFGYRRTSMDDIAREACVAKGTLYLYFASKEALFCALLARTVTEAERLCNAAQEQGGDLTAQIFGQLDAWFGTWLDHYGLSGHLSELAAARMSVGREVVETADQAYEARLVGLIEAAQEEGRASLASTSLDARQVVSVLLAAARGAKYSKGVTVTPDAFRTSLKYIAHVTAAAIRKT